MSIQQRKFAQLSLLSFSIIFSIQPRAAVIDDIGFVALQAELVGGLIPIGSGVNVSLVEALTGTACANASLGNCRYLPDSSIETYTDQSTGFGLSTDFSGHATGSAERFYGNSSTSSGVTNIDVYAADHWLTDGYLNIGAIAPSTSSTRVSSHSYVGNADNSSLGILQRIDYLADKDDHILMVALNNGSSKKALNSTAYNVISVGRTDGNHPLGTVDVNQNSGLYNSTIRSGADIVVPESTTSGATPRVASAAALLVGYGHDQALGKSNGSLTNRNNDIIYHAETSEVIKATIMAGASRTTSNTAVTADITDYRSAGNQTTNGLDTRYGAGQLNIQNSYHILAAGEQDAGNVLSTGFDYDDSFGSSNGSNNLASYLFTSTEDLADFSASLVWNIVFDVSDTEIFSDSVGSLFDLNLSLLFFNGTGFEEVASSNSSIDNTENIWQQLLAGDYRLDVAANGNFVHDYGLAWQTSAVPIPGAVWLFGSALGGLLTLRRKKTDRAL